jgi:molecular chaperone DnaK (HSP70)
MSTGRQLLDELRRDEELRRALAEELLPEALRHRELRRVMLIAISREMATKDDIESLRRATKEDAERLEAELKSYVDARITELKSYMDSRINEFKSYVDARINDVNTRMSDLYGVMKASLVAIVVTLASTILVPLIIRIFF